MIKIENLKCQIETDEGDKEILKGISLDIPDGEVHAIMGPNGSGKSTLSYVLAGRDDYEVTGGSASLDGVDLLDMEPEERAAAGLFLAFQYPVEIPGVNMSTFLKTSLNAIRKQRTRTTSYHRSYHTQPCRSVFRKSRCAGLPLPGTDPWIPLSQYLWQGVERRCRT